MHKKWLIIIVLFGFLLVSNQLWACVKKEQTKSCCPSKAIVEEKDTCCSGKAESDKKDTCCGSTTETSDKSCCASDTENGCDGTCNHAGCSCVATCSVNPVSLVVLTSFDFTLTNFTTFKKGHFLYQIPSLSDGFTSIWLIPKIS
jgi:hypothetical protein